MMMTFAFAPGKFIGAMSLLKSIEGEGGGILNHTRELTTICKVRKIIFIFPELKL